MNERIRELSDKCGLACTLKTEQDVKNLVEFAELIVRECVTKMASEIMNNSWIDDAVKNTYKHFGVE